MFYVRYVQPAFTWHATRKACVKFFITENAAEMWKSEYLKTVEMVGCPCPSDCVAGPVRIDAGDVIEVK